MRRARFIAERLMRWTAALAPAARGEWMRAMRAEFDAIDDEGSALGWAMGCWKAALMWKLESNGAAYGAAVIAAAAGLLYVEWHTDEVTVVLALLLVLAGVMGAAWPRRFVVSGAVLGLALPAAHGLTEALGRFRPRYMHAAPSITDALTLAVLIVPALMAAGAGALAMRTLRKRAA